MPYRFAHLLVLSFAGTLLVCVVLFLLSEFPALPSLMCCGYSMDFPFLCLFILLSLFGIIAVLFDSTRKQGGDGRLRTASSKLFTPFLGLVFSDYFRGWFAVSLLLSTTLVLLGTALLFSLSLSFAWPVLALGCLSLLGGLLIPLLGGGSPRDK